MKTDCCHLSPFDNGFNMSNETPPTSCPNIQAPTYTELFNQAESLRARLEALENKHSNVDSEPSADVVPPPCNNYRLLPDLNKTVPVFTGHETSCEAEDWINTVDAMAGINNWPVPYRLQYTKSNMSNAARSWFLTETFRDWVDFMAKFRTTFVRELRMSDRWEAMTVRRQGDTEHVADYFYDKLRLCQALNLSFYEIRDHIVLGIHSQELAVFAMGRYHTSTAALLADLQEGGRLFELRRAQGATVKPSEDKGWKSFPKSQRKTAAPAPTAEVQNTTVIANKTTSIRESTTVRCFNCNMNGHIARDCPKPRKPCSGCQSTAHTRSRCPGKPAQAMLVGPMLSEPQNSFIKDILFNEVRATCLIDTGSSHVLVRNSLVHRSAATVRWTSRPLYTVGDTHRPGAATLGEATADITVDGALGADHGTRGERPIDTSRRDCRTLMVELAAYRVLQNE